MSSLRFRCAALVCVVPLAVALSVPGVASARSTTSATVQYWLDGDSLMTSQGEVRIVGIDTPEKGACGADAARAYAEKLAPAGTAIRLLDPRSVKNKDRYGRLLRYVVVGSVDVGLKQIRRGAKARYDSRDGYQPHPREQRYRRVDRARPDYTCTSAPAPVAMPAGQASYPPVAGTTNCPAAAPIKGNRGADEWIYHLPQDTYYAVTSPEECFATEAAAQAAGYRAARI